MSRLIDVDELLEDISTYMYGENMKMAREIINLQPIAFDAEKVLNELVVLHNLVNMNQKLAVSQAIDIVKRGGQK